MRASFPVIVTRAVALGLAAGSRGALGPCAPLWARARAEGREKTRRLSMVAITGELVADKTPKIPSRTSGPMITLRTLSGATGGVLLARALGGPAVLTSGIAAVAAPVGAVAGVRWRARWGTHRSPWVGAVLEDAVALTLARWALSGHTSHGP